MNPEGLPLSLLGAACYHLAGYPARASSLGRHRANEQDAPLLRLLLQSDFEGLLSLAPSVARESRTGLPGSDAEMGQSAEGSPATAADVHDLVVREVAAALGVVAGEFRWGGGRRTSQALAKLRAAASVAMMVADPYEWLLLKLAAETAEASVGASLRTPVAALARHLGAAAFEVFERYVRLAYLNRQILVWPSQARGLTRLAEGGSFALCTPTGSGKTRIAEVALLEGLFRADTAERVGVPLCLYIVPTRSLAAEVEARFSRILRQVGGVRAVTVTGLYGGTDWGPNDDWLLSDEPTVLICTQEKCEALLRFFGQAILPRLRVVIVDEAHEVQHAQSSEVLEAFESRALRLESLVARLRARLPDTRFIAISAVARHLERPLARWISGGSDSEAVTSDYRSTRQLVGRLLCRVGRGTRIEYDVLDGEPLEVRGLGDDAAYVPEPFPPHPPADEFTGAKKGMAPFALWAALQLAGGDESGGYQSVLISVVEGIANFVGWCVSLLEDVWGDVELPEFFVEPTPDSDDRRLWELALKVTEDLFGPESRELRLLRRGIAVHHGRMPGRLPRLIVELVERRIVRVVIATSTLTQGVNLPFETILIPGLKRQSGRLTPQEFANLVGRAGRPGVATEGQALVLLLDGVSRWQREQAAAEYQATIRDWVGGASALTSSESPLAALINLIWTRWPGTDPDEFERWLELTAVGEGPAPPESPLAPLDVLDGVLVAALEDSELETEDALRRVWSETFARYASAEEERLSRVFIVRGEAVARHFVDLEERRRVYQTSLPPREARQLREVAPILLDHFRTGRDYWRWDSATRYQFVERAVEIVSEVKRFSPRPTVGRSKATWQDVLRWWLDPAESPVRPSVAQVGVWHDFVAQQFAYRFAWGASAMTLLGIPAGATASVEALAEAEIPSAALWIKDLVMWGTLEPVAAYLLARRVADARPDAEALARDYYDGMDVRDVGDPLDPGAIRAWASTLQGPPRHDRVRTLRARIDVQLDPRLANAPDFGRWRVVPNIGDGQVEWLDVAGYLLAESAVPEEWTEPAVHDYDFVLNPAERIVEATAYL
jgi:DEAD/DEAH box helicase